MKKTTKATAKKSATKAAAKVAPQQRTKQAKKIASAPAPVAKKPSAKEKARESARQRAAAAPAASVAKANAAQKKTADAIRAIVTSPSSATRKSIASAIADGVDAAAAAPGKVSKVLFTTDAVEPSERTQRTSRAPRESSRSTSAPRSRTSSELHPLLRTVIGERYTRILAAKGWTLDTMPAEKLKILGERMTLPAMSALFGEDEAKIKAVCAKKSVAIREGSQPRIAKERTANESRVVKKTPGASASASALVDDERKAVPISSLPIGTRFKTPDSPSEGIRGFYGTIARHGLGSTTISGAPHDYLASSTRVVPIA